MDDFQELGGSSVPVTEVITSDMMTAAIMKLTHVDRRGAARMVDISEKENTRRTATASAHILTTPAVIREIKRNRIGKGDVFAVARVAGIQAAKRTSTMIPLCHELWITSVAIHIRFVGSRDIHVESEITTVGRTGPDMEALSSVSASCLTIYDMCKSLDRNMTIKDIRLTGKTGGKTGTFKRRS